MGKTESEATELEGLSQKYRIQRRVEILAEVISRMSRLEGFMDSVGDQMFVSGGYKKDITSSVKDLSALLSDLILEDVCEPKKDKFMGSDC